MKAAFRSPVFRSSALTLLTSCLTSFVLLAAPASAAEVGLYQGPFVPARPASAPACPPPTAPLEVAVWRVAVADGRPDLSCQNEFMGFQRTPRSAEVPQDAFDLLAGQVREARAEVLISSMDYMSFEGHPGHRVNLAIRDLYQKVKADPQAYPDGLAIRLMTGGTPPWLEEVGTRDFVRDLLELGVPLHDPALGWSVQAANFRYFPHSHIKLFVIDGRDVTVAGFSIADWHQTSDLPGGHDLRDLGLRMRGPVAQDGVAVFDDQWALSRRLYCPLEIKPAEVSRCTLGEPSLPRHPPLAQVAAPAAQARAFVLYRRPGYEMADQAQLALLAAAREQIDVFQTDFSPRLSCWWAYRDPEGCTATNAAPYFQALIEAMRRGVKVRAILVNYGEGALPNRSGVALMRAEAKRLGLSDLFEARYYDGPMHTKTFTVDAGAASGGMVVTGSMNFHFSAWGPLGLGEAAIATSDPRAVAEQAADFQHIWDTRTLPIPPEPWLEGR